MAGNLEKRNRETLWEMLRDLPNLLHLNGIGRWHASPKPGRQAKLKKANNCPNSINTRRPPAKKFIFRSFTNRIGTGSTFGKFVSVLFIIFLLTGFRQSPVYSSPANLGANVTVYATIDDTVSLANALVNLTDESNPGNVYSVVTDDSGKAFIPSVALGVFNRERTLPEGFSLEQNFPNPWNPSTKFKYSVPKNGNVSVFVSNVRGERVKTFANGVLDRGNYEAVWGGENDAGRNVADGIYFYSVVYNGKIISKKMTKLGGGSLNSSNSKVGEPMFSRLEKITSQANLYKLEISNTDSISREILPYLMNNVPISQDTALYVNVEKVPRRELTGIITEFFSAMPDSGALVKTSVDSAYTNADGEYSVLATFGREDVLVLKPNRLESGFIVEPGSDNLIVDHNIAKDDSSGGIDRDFFIDYILSCAGGGLGRRSTLPDSFYVSLTEESVPDTVWIVGNVKNEEGYIASVGFKNVAQLNEMAKKMNTMADSITNGLYNIGKTKIVIADTVFMSPDSVAKFLYSNMSAVHNDEFPVNNLDKLKKSLYITASNGTFAANATFFDNLTVKGHTMKYHRDLPIDYLGEIFNQEFISSILGGVETPDDAIPSVLRNSGTVIHPHDRRIVKLVIDRGPEHIFPDFPKNFSPEVMRQYQFPN